ncbi:DNA cytosine methyltransferase [Halorussus sp. AFM4]|uniref:DNA cytosine methyltransferase n=1 Tax=Halorussus sp. AFM4 TaxID=3421651 RepID=UPI003EB9E713
MRRERSRDVIRAVDLFCGAGGLSWGLVEALKSIAIETDQPTEAVLEDSIDLVGVNHWEQAIATHKENHPWARHFHDDIQTINPRDVFDERDPDVKILSGGIECTHWSTARGGKPVDDQKRMPAWDFLTWIQKLRPENVLVENVKEFCFAADSMVLTEDGPIPIQDVEVGTRVLTHKGRWKEVTNTSERTDRTIKVSGRSNRLVECTPDHHFYAREINAECWGGKRGRHTKKFGDPDWVPADNLVPEHETKYQELYDGHYWSTPQSFDTDALEVPENPDRIKETDEAFGRMIGLWLGDGWFRKRDRPQPPHGLRIAGQDPKLQSQLEDVDYLSWNKQIRKGTNTYVYETTAKGLAHWIKEHFGEYADGKTIPSWVLALSEDHRKALVEGYQQADGSVDSYGRASAKTASKQLVVGIKHVLESLGVAAGLPAPIEPNEENRQTMYTVTWDWDLSVDDNDQTFKEGDYRWTRVVDTEPASESTTVYDLTVADDHSFIVDGVVAHNSSWGPIESDGTPTRNGETFEAWIDSFHSLGYSIDWKVLNAANYGDATSRERLFILARRENRPEWPEPTHTEDGEGDTQEWRTAADIIDWSEPGGSIWTRDLHEARKRPLKNSTMQRIAEGVRRHCRDRLEPLADALAELGREDVKQLRQSVVPFEYAETAAEVLDEPFLVEQPAGAAPALAAPYLLRQQSGGQPPSIEDEPVPTISSAGSIAKVEPRPLIMPRNGAMGGLHSNSLYRPEDRPLHTVTARNTDGYLVTPYLCPMYNGREGQRPRTRRVDRPLMTIPASKSPAGVATPFLVDYHGNSDVSPCDIPLGAVEARDRYALCVPEEFPWGIDVRYRML